MDTQNDIIKSYEPSGEMVRITERTQKLSGKFPPKPWLDNPDAWDRDLYIDQTAQEIIDVYGALSDHDQVILSLLADQISSYVECTRLLKEQGHVYVYNAGKTTGPSPAFQMRLKALESMVKLMNELGITLKARSGSSKVRDHSEVDEFLRGPKG